MARDPKRRLFDIRGKEISTVSGPANEEPFFVVKARGGPKEGSMSGKGAGNPEAGVKPPQDAGQEPVTKQGPEVPPELLETITKVAESVTALSTRGEEIGGQLAEIRKNATPPAAPPTAPPAESKSEPPPSGASGTEPAADPLARVATQLEQTTPVTTKRAAGSTARTAATGTSKQPPSNRTDEPVQKSGNFWDGFLPE